MTTKKKKQSKKTISCCFGAIGFKGNMKEEEKSTKIIDPANKTIRTHLGVLQLHDPATEPRKKKKNHS